MQHQREQQEIVDQALDVTTDNQLKLKDVPSRIADSGS